MVEIIQSSTSCHSQDVGESKDAVFKLDDMTASNPQLSDCIVVGEQQLTKTLSHLPATPLEIDGTIPKRTGIDMGGQTWFSKHNEPKSQKCQATWHITKHNQCPFKGEC